MVEETVNKEQSQRQFETPEQELQRAVSDYLYVSRNYTNYYAVSGYIEAEEKAWQRLEKALKDPELEV